MNTVACSAALTAGSVFAFHLAPTLRGEWPVVMLLAGAMVLYGMCLGSRGMR